jgi:hypothetical protein
MSDSDSVVSLTDIGESLQIIHQHVEHLAHVSKHIYSRALKVHQLVEHPEMDIWVQPFKLHERARSWAKKNMVASKCSLWQVHETLLESAKKGGRITGAGVNLTVAESEILDLPIDEAHGVWKILGRLPRFFI